MGCNLYTNIEECPLLNMSVEYDGDALKKSDKNLAVLLVASKMGTLGEYLPEDTSTIPDEWWLRIIKAVSWVGTDRCDEVVVDEREWGTPVCSGFFKYVKSEKRYSDFEKRYYNQNFYKVQLISEKELFIIIKKVSSLVNLIPDRLRLKAALINPYFLWFYDWNIKLKMLIENTDNFDARNYFVGGKDNILSVWGGNAAQWDTIDEFSNGLGVAMQGVKDNLRVLTCMKPIMDTVASLGGGGIISFIESSFDPDTFLLFVTDGFPEKRGTHRSYMPYAKWLKKYYDTGEDDEIPESGTVVPGFIVKPSIGYISDIFKYLIVIDTYAKYLFKNGTLLGNLVSNICNKDIYDLVLKNVCLLDGLRYLVSSSIKYYEYYKDKRIDLPKFWESVMKFRETAPKEKYNERWEYSSEAVKVFVDKYLASILKSEIQKGYDSVVSFFLKIRGQFQLFDSSEYFNEILEDTYDVTTRFERKGLILKSVCDTIDLFSRVYSYPDTCIKIGGCIVIGYDKDRISTQQVSGVVYEPIIREWHVSKDKYILFVVDTEGTFTSSNGNIHLFDIGFLDGSVEDFVPLEMNPFHP